MAEITTLHEAVTHAKQLAQTTREPHVILFIKDQYVVREFKTGDGLHPHYVTSVEPVTDEPAS